MDATKKDKQHKDSQKIQKKLTASQKAKQDFMNAQKRIMGDSPNWYSNIFVYIFISIGIFLVFLSFISADMNSEEIPIGDAIQYIRQEEVQEVVVAGNRVELQLKDGTKYFTKKEAGISFDEILSNSNIDKSLISGSLKVEDRMDIGQILGSVIIYGIPILILLFIFRSIRSSSGDVFSFGKSRAKIFNKESSKITFDDVAGIQEAKKEMVEIVDFLKNPQKYQKLGARVPKGVLLVGPAGVGKTLLAKAIAGEANVPFFSVAGSEFMEMLVGVGSSRVRDLFNMARFSQPSLIFIDEIDAIGRQRGMGIGGGHDEREQTLNQILIEMDGFDPRTNVIVIAATNRPDMLDPALVRAGRFDRRVTLSLPDLEDRKEILKIHMKGKPFASDFDLEKVGKKTVGFSGADLENVLNEAAILAARDEQTQITMRDIDNAALKITLGPERRRLQDENDRKMTAYHEAGHAVVGAKVAGLDPVGRVTIVPRGGSLGHTSLPPERDRFNETKSRLLSMISMMLGGRAAEEIVFNEMTTGASNDIDRATQLARKMVTEFGMSSLGPVAYDASEGSKLWLAKQMGEMPHYSQEMAAKIDHEVQKIIENAYNEAKDILQNNRESLDKVVEALLDKETIDGDEFAEIMGIKKEETS